MGIDKRSVRLLPASPTFLQRTVAVGRAVADRVAVIGDPYPNVRATFVPDRWPSEGPLGALVTAFGLFPDHDLLVLASDYPLLQVELAARLIDSLNGHAGSVAVDGGGRRHPLVAAYDARRCAGIARTLFGAGERSMAALVDRICVRLVLDDDVGDSHGASLSNVNTAEDLDALRVRCQSLDRGFR